MPGILVVEDDENLNRGITFSLKKSGYEVFSADFERCHSAINNQTPASYYYPVLLIEYAA